MRVKRYQYIGCIFLCLGYLSRMVLGLLYGLNIYLNKILSIITSSLKSVMVAFKNLGDRLIAMPWSFDIHVPRTVQANILKLSNILKAC